MQTMTAAEFNRIVATRTVNKYKNRKLHGFDSIAEANRGAELEIMQRNGDISCLCYQVSFPVINRSDSERGARYVVDFLYLKNGILVAEDKKGVKTQAYILKRKLFKARYPQILFLES